MAPTTSLVVTRASPHCISTQHRTSPPRLATPSEVLLRPALASNPYLSTRIPTGVEDEHSTRTATDEQRGDHREQADEDGANGTPPT
ncbi:hypothetical protein NLJ89_g11519 [Agrocybe chaxingu]|uniref:Uncharacterized protein n=1 Tax=Agrocybe chaxingu TaxID=84603 RepID=A0A9W8MMY7_9AGAR|nr:hypothetical protein NLJ89_g11519 [Agrocybe chaxingu]